jgi:hypothetical protein
MYGARIGALKLIMAKFPVAGSVAWVYRSPEFARHCAL